MRRVGWNTLARPALTFWQWRFKFSAAAGCMNLPAAHKPMGPFCGELTGPPVNGGFKKRAPAAPLAGGFDDIEVRVLVEAFDEAWKRILEDGDSLVGDGHAEATRELLALRIIEIAQLGERDPSRLRDDALAYLARTNLMSTGL